MEELINQTVQARTSASKTKDAIMASSEQLIALGIDLDDTLDRFGGNAGFLEKMLHLFVQGDTVDRMVEAFTAQNADALERTSHAIKGSAANLGFTELSSRASDVCEFVRATHTAEVPQDMIDYVVEGYKRICDGVAAL